MPFLSFQMYALHVLFPGLDDHPVLHQNKVKNFTELYTCLVEIILEVTFCSENRILQKRKILYHSFKKTHFFHFTILTVSMLQEKNMEFI